MEPGTSFKVKAFLVGSRLDLRGWPGAETVGLMPLSLRLPGGGVAVLFRHGCAVVFDGPPDAERELLARLAPRVDHPYATPETEELDARIEPGASDRLDGATLVLADTALPRLQLVANVLSKSLLLAHYETRLALDFDRIEPLALELERTGGLRGRTRSHLKQIGSLLLVEHRMVGRAEVGEKPEVLWEHPELERFHALLDGEFELRERLSALERKVDLAGRTVRTLVDLIDARHALRVEWYIVALIVFEIVLTLWQMARG
ncbi:MAG: RMD1 family protein [Burkholderiales bacterium]|nr:RMD1 family protein [Burkholderiales bacterium]